MIRDDLRPLDLDNGTLYISKQPRRAVTAEHLKALQQIGKIPNFTPPSKHAAGRVGKKRPKRRNRRKP